MIQRVMALPSLILQHTPPAWTATAGNVLIRPGVSDIWMNVAGVGASDLLIAADELKLADELPIKRIVYCGGEGRRTAC